MHGLVDRHPTVSPERLIAQLIPPPPFAEVGFRDLPPRSGGTDAGRGRDGLSGFLPAGCRAPGGPQKDDFDELCAHLATMHPSR